MSATLATRSSILLASKRVCRPLWAGLSELEDADRFARAEHLVSGFVTLRNVFGIDGGPAVARILSVDGDHRVFERREGAQGEQIDLDKAQRFDVIFVELDDGSAFWPTSGRARAW